MRFEIIALLSWLVREGYITSFHVTKDKIYVTIKKPFCGLQTFCGKTIDFLGKPCYNKNTTRAKPLNG